MVNQMDVLSPVFLVFMGVCMGTVWVGKQFAKPFKWMFGEANPEMQEAPEPVDLQEDEN